MSIIERGTKVTEPAPTQVDSGDSEPRVNWRVFTVASLIIIAFSAWALIAPKNADTSMVSIVGWVAQNVGWVYVVTVTVVIGFVLWVALTKVGTIRMGPDHSRPQYKLFTWVAQLFAAGVGIDMLFYSVTGPATQYMNPPEGKGQTAAAAEDAVVWTMFHYGMAGWAMYALLGMAMGYFAYRRGTSLSIRAVLAPLIGKRVNGRIGDSIDVVTLVGTVFGVATAMGIGVVLLSIGVSLIFGFAEGLALQIALVTISVALTAGACTSGVDKGIRWIAELNIWSAAAVLLYILITGQTSFLLNAITQNIGQFIVTMPGRTLETFAYESGGSDWMAGWTLFFWAFWLAWGPFVGLFLARISRGRTLREFAIAAITVPVLCDFLVVSTFGNSAMHRILGGDTAFAKLAIDNPQRGWYALLEAFPGAPLLIGLGTISGVLFYLTSANSGAMMMSNFSSTIRNPAQDGAKWLRVFWAVLTALLTVAMLVAGGVTTMEHATLIFALPVTIIAWLVMVSFAKALRVERAHLQGTASYQLKPAPAGADPDDCWRKRLASIGSYPSKCDASQFMTLTIRPAMAELVEEFATIGRTASLRILPSEDVAIHGCELTVKIPDSQDFLYHVQCVEARIPTFGGDTDNADGLYYRAEAFTQRGSQGHDLMGASRRQVIDDALTHYERHLMFLASLDELPASHPDQL